MENISVLLGAMALLSVMIVYPTLICGSMAIVFALLSKGGERSITARARTGLILGIIALVVMAFLVTYVIMLVIGMYGGLSNLPYDAYGNLNTGTILNDMYTYLYSSY
jgi:hypothetical protein